MLSKSGVKHKLKYITGALLICLLLSAGICAFAKQDKADTISDGIHIGSVDVSGMTYDDALDAVNEYANSISGTAVNLNVGENKVSVTASELGFNCDTESIVKHALKLGKSGNIVKRYKERKDLETNGSVINLPLEFSDDAIRAVLEEKCRGFDVAAVDAGLTKTSS